MLFNSYVFLFLFLPITLVGYQVAGKIHRKAVIVWLGIASVAFYAYWKPGLLYILLCSIGVNYVASCLISGRIPNKISPRAWLVLAIVIDLAALGYFKYFFPYLNIAGYLMGLSHHWDNVILPLGISFFTFTQIAYLIDLYQGVAKDQDMGSYLLFVTFFPHLIAGPILHHKEMMPQFQQDRRYQLNLGDISVGFSWFVMGLGKKMLIADSFGTMADKVFANSQWATVDAWVGALSYCLQLYFDFSGYSDMALGLARMFSINFPLNFNSPYKASSIIEFWQRWHMTLSHYIMAYLYTPLQRWVRERRQSAGLTVSRKDMLQPRVFMSLVGFPMMTTMFIAGIWHGAGVQFLIFGLLHGSYLTINHALRLKFGTPAPQTHTPLSWVKRSRGVLLTLLCVMVSFVFFRSSSATSASHMLEAMIGIRTKTPIWGGRQILVNMSGDLLGFMAVWFLPSTQELLARFKPSLQEGVWITGESHKKWIWSPSAGWACALGLVLLLALIEIQKPSSFLYFQF